MTDLVPFNRPSVQGRELDLLHEALISGHWSGNGSMTEQAESLLSDISGGSALLTTSCTHALELAARLVNVMPGDEVIVPAFTFMSSASAFALYGAKPVFVDVLPQTLNLNPDGLSAAITSKTKAIVTVHYAGIGDQVDRVRDIATKHQLPLIEDNAHGLGGKYLSQPLGTFGELSTLSFHETKNVTCGEGGALVINDKRLTDRAEILRDKGTNRGQFMRGQVDKYTWRDLGSSWVPSELLAALLVGQLESFDHIQTNRMLTWNMYRDELAAWAESVGARLPYVPAGAEHSAHLFYLHMQDVDQRTRFIAHMRQHNVMCVFHYQALNTSPQGWLFGGKHGQCPVAESAADTLVRLPLFNDMTQTERSRVIDIALRFTN